MAKDFAGPLRARAAACEAEANTAFVASVAPSVKTPAAVAIGSINHAHVSPIDSVISLDFPLKVKNHYHLIPRHSIILIPITIIRQVAELRRPRFEVQADLAGRAVALFGDDQL